jgi:hypothetical protein
MADVGELSASAADCSRVSAADVSSADTRETAAENAKANTFHHEDTKDTEKNKEIDHC